MKNRNFWKVFSFSLAVVLLSGLAGCSKPAEESSVATPSLSGGSLELKDKGTDVGIAIEGSVKASEAAPEAPSSMGTYNTAGAVAGAMAEEAKAALEAALTGSEFEAFKALTCYGVQSVAGVNYQFIGVLRNELYTAKVFHPLSGKDELSACTVFDLAACLAENADLSGSASEAVAAGGWTVPQESNLSTMPQDLASAFSVLFNDGYSLKILAALGSKAAEGGNDYALLCQNMSAENGGLYVAELNAKSLGKGGTLLAVHPFKAE